MQILSVIFKFFIAFLTWLTVAAFPGQAQTYSDAIFLRETFPLTAALPQLRPSQIGCSQNLNSGVPESADEFCFNLESAWSNTHNRRRDAFLVDAETRIVDLGVSYSSDRSQSYSIALPLYWKGGGVLDQSIFEWHDFFNLPQGPRDDMEVSNDRYRVTALTKDGQRADLERDGFGIGDLDLRHHRRFSVVDPNLRLDTGFGLILPTARREYGLDGTALVVSLATSQTINRWSLYASTQLSYLTNRKLDNFEFSPLQSANLLGAGMNFDQLSIYLGLVGNFGLVKNIRELPRYQVYLDTGVRFKVGDLNVITLAIRENPSPDEGSADVTFYLGLSSALH